VQTLAFFIANNLKKKITHHQGSIFYLFPLVDVRPTEIYVVGGTLPGANAESIAYLEHKKDRQGRENE